MSALGVHVADSAFLASVDARDRSFPRFLGALVCGLLGGLLIGLIVGGGVLIAFAVGTMPHGAPLTALPNHILELIGPAQPTLISSLSVMAMAVATNGPLAIAFIGIAALFSRHHMRDYLTAARRFRWQMLGCGLLLSVIVIGPVIALSQLLDPHAPPAPLLSLAPDFGSRMIYAVAAFALLIPAAAAEEVVFRGWMLRQTAAVTRNLFVLMAVNGVLFSAVHGEFALDAFLTRALMGAGFVYMTLRLGGIEFSTGAHAANNILIVLFLQPLTAKSPPATPFDWTSLLQDAFLFAAYIAMAELTARWGPLRRLSGADQTVGPVAISAAEHFA